MTKPIAPQPSREERRVIRQLYQALMEAPLDPANFPRVGEYSFAVERRAKALHSFRQYNQKLSRKIES